MLRLGKIGAWGLRSSRHRCFSTKQFSGPIWTAARTQEQLNRHEKIVDCTVQDVVYEEGVGGRLGLIVPVASPSFFVNPFTNPFADSELGEDDVRSYLDEHDYTGPCLDVRFVSVEELDDAVEDPSTRHKRVVMRNLVQSIFKQVDADNDGQVTFEEVMEFLRRHNIDEADVAEVAERFHEQDTQDNYSLNYAQFKALLRETNLLRSKGVDGHFQSFQVVDHLQDFVTREIFFHADERGRGHLDVADVERVFEQYYAGDASQAKLAFSQYDRDGDGEIGLEEFRELVVHEGVVSITS